MTPTQPCRCFGTIAGAAFALATSYLAGAQTTPTTPPTKEEVIQLSEFMVSAAADRGYATANTAGATRVNIAIKNTPLSVVPLNAEFLQDTGALTVAQAARYVSGVAFAGTPIVSQLTVRGQNTPGAVFRDGVPDAIQIRGGTPNDTALVERVEVIKGPAGTLYGSHNSGGIVNTITKAPSAIARHQVRAIADDFGTYRGELDSQGPLALKGASYRVVLAAQQGETAQGTKNDATIVSPMMMFVRPSGLRLLARYAYQHIDIGANSYPWFTDSLGQVSTFIPRRRMISENDVSRDTEIHFVDLEAEQRFSTAAIDWAARLKLNYGRSEGFVRLYEQAANLYEFRDPNGVTIGNITNMAFNNPAWHSILIRSRTRSEVDALQEQGVANLDFVGNFRVGVSTHKLLLYGTYARGLGRELGFAAPYPGIEITSPNPVRNDNPASLQGTPVRNIDVNNQTWSHAFSVQDNVSFLEDRLILVAGVRYDRRTADNINRVNNTRTFNDVRDGVSQKFGVLGRPWAPVGLYYNYSETFTPQGQDQLTGNVLPNLEPATNEAGVKLNLLGDRLIVNAAYFETITKNAIITVQTVDSAGATRTTAVPAGELVVDGWELDGTWSPLPGLDVLFGIGSLESRSQTGLRARGVPQGVNYRAFGRYTFAAGPVKGFLLGAGIERTSKRALDNNDSATSPPYTLVDFLAGYGWQRWRAQINVYNAFDKVAVGIGVARQIVYPVERRRVQFSLTHTW